MRHLALPAVAALALLAGCKDTPKQTPTEPEAPEAAALARVPVREDAETGSTLCAAYRQQLRESRAALAAATSPTESGELRETVATFQAVIADACP